MNPGVLGERDGFLPESTSMFMVIGGHVEAGPYPSMFREVLLKQFGAAAEKDMTTAVDELRKAMTGDVAISASAAPRTGLEISTLFSVSRTKVADRAIAGMLALFEVARTENRMGQSMTLEANPGTTTHDGVGLRSCDITYDFSKVSMLQQMPATKRDATVTLMQGTQSRAQVAAFDGLGQRRHGRSARL
jgi:hypothetical protein